MSDTNLAAVFIDLTEQLSNVNKWLERYSKLTSPSEERDWIQKIERTLALGIENGAAPIDLSLSSVFDLEEIEATATKDNPFTLAFKNTKLNVWLDGDEYCAAASDDKLIEGLQKFNEELEDLVTELKDEVKLLKEAAGSAKGKPNLRR